MKRMEWNSMKWNGIEWNGIELNDFIIIEEEFDSYTLDLYRERVECEWGKGSIHKSLKPLVRS